MSETFFVSDTHFGHHNIITFEARNRPFATIEEHDEELIKRWNLTVGPDDAVIHLGDVAFNTRLPLVERLNGRKKTLLMGNHEHKKATEYLKYFDDVKSYLDLDWPDFGYHAIVSHIPVHPCQLESRFQFNIHGHLHGDRIPDWRYVNISVEHTDLKPISLSALKQECEARLKGAKQMNQAIQEEFNGAAV